MRGNNVATATDGSPTNEGNEFFEFEGKKFSFEVELDDTINVASDIDSDEEDEPLVLNEDSNKSTESASERVVEVQSKLVELSRLCKDVDLKKNAKLVDELCTFPLVHNETSNIFLSHMANIEK